VNNIN